MLIQLRKELDAAQVEIRRLEHALCESRLLAARAEPQVEVRAELCHVIDGEHDLTPREHEVLLRLMAGDNVAQIGQRLYMARSTAKCHIVRLYHKLGVHNRAGAVMAGVRMGFDQPSPE